MEANTNDNNNTDTQALQPQLQQNNNSRHIFSKNRNYYTISIYVIATVVICAILLKIIINWTSTVSAINQIISLLSPFLLGFFIAYILNPLIRNTDEKIFNNFFKLKNSSVRKALSILLVYLIVFGILTVCIVVVIPELYNSILNIYSSIQDYYNEFMKFINSLNKKYPDIDLSYVTNIVEKNSTNIVDFLQGSIATILPVIYNTSRSVISGVINFFIAVIVSCYMLIDKDIMSTNAKKVVYSFFKKEKADSFLSTVFECNEIFSGFIVGKAIDSTIIGILCFVFMNIMQLPYTVLVSVIVGILNMIPYFGPFIGAIPGAILCLTVSWQDSLMFIILAIILQSFDGLYLGPKILGDSTGLRPLWIIFAISAGGFVAGIIGMFLGVPIVAVIAFLCDRYINRTLAAKNITTDDFIVSHTHDDSKKADSDTDNNTNNKKSFRLFKLKTKK